MSPALLSSLLGFMMKTSNGNHLALQLSVETSIEPVSDRRQITQTGRSLWKVSIRTASFCRRNRVDQTCLSLSASLQHDTSEISAVSTACHQLYFRAKDDIDWRDIILERHGYCLISWRQIWKSYCSWSEIRMLTKTQSKQQRRRRTLLKKQ